MPGHVAGLRDVARHPKSGEWIGSGISLPTRLPRGEQCGTVVRLLKSALNKCILNHTVWRVVSFSSVPFSSSPFPFLFFFPVQESVRYTPYEIYYDHLFICIGFAAVNSK